MRDTQDEKSPSGFGAVPPFWLRPADKNGHPIDARVRDASQSLWPWAYRHVERELHDAASAAELLEEVAIEVSVRLRDAPEVARNLKGYLITSFHHRVRSRMLRHNRIRYEGLVRELERSHALKAPDWAKAIENEIYVDLLISYLPHPIRHMLNRRMLGFSWKEIGDSLNIPAKNAKARFYYGIQRAHEALLSDVDGPSRGDE